MVESIRLVRLDNGQSIDINMDDSPYYVLSSCSWGQVEGDANTVKYVKQFGKTVLSSTVGTRDVKIVGWVVADGNGLMASLKDFLNQFVSPLQFLKLLYDGKYVTFLPDKSVTYDTGYESNNDTIAKFTITGTCYDPMWHDEYSSKFVAAETVGMFHFPLEFHDTPASSPEVVFASIVSNVMFELQNIGDVSSGFTVVFKSKGTVTNPYIKNVATQEKLTIKKTMVLGEALTVSTVIGDRHVRQGELDDDGASMFKYVDPDSDWLQLPVGTSLMTFGADVGADVLDVYVVFENQYLEVQGCY